MQWKGHKCGKATVMGIARELSLAQIMIKKLEIVDFINYLFNMISNNLRYEIQFRISIA
jgi:hypothetical protein